MRSDVQAASLRIQHHARSYNEKDASGLGGATFQVCKGHASCLLQMFLHHGEHRGLSRPTCVLRYSVGKPDLRGTINAMVRLIEGHGIAELQRVGVLSQEGGMRHV